MFCGWTRKPPVTILRLHLDMLIIESIYSWCYLTINWGISVCVCVSFRLYVSTVLNRSSPSLEGTLLQSAHLRARAWLRIHLSMDRFSSNLQWTYKSHQVAWATYFSCSRTAHACERVVKHSLIYGQTLLNLRWTYYKSQQVAWQMYFSWSLTLRARAWKRLVKTFTHLWTDSLQMCWAHTTHDHKLHTATHLSSGTAGTRASALVINCSLIYGRVLFKFGVNILHLTTSSKGYVLFMFTHRARASSHVRAV
jgi:hypothetical protein